MPRVKTIVVIAVVAIAAAAVSIATVTALLPRSQPPMSRFDLSLRIADGGVEVAPGQAFGLELVASNAGPDPATLDGEETFAVSRITGELTEGVILTGDPSGAGWDCSASNESVIDCIRDDPIPASSDAPAVTARVQVIDSYAADEISTTGCVTNPAETGDRSDNCTSVRTMVHTTGDGEVAAGPVGNGPPRALEPARSSEQVRTPTAEVETPTTLPHTGLSPEDWLLVAASAVLVGGIASEIWSLRVRPETHSE